MAAVTRFVGDGWVYETANICRFVGDSWYVGTTVAAGGGGLSIPVAVQNMDGGFWPIGGRGGFVNG